MRASACAVALGTACVVTVLLTLLTSAACGAGAAAAPEETLTPTDTGTVVDVEGNVYRTVQIGSQEWMSENLRATRSPAGASLSGVYAYGNQESNVQEHGRLYLWNAARSACPQGWRLPSAADWTTLETTVGVDAGTKLKVGGSSGFEGKLSGLWLAGRFEFLGQVGVFWTSTESGNAAHAVNRMLTVDGSELRADNTGVDHGLSVRCLRN